MSTLEIPPLNVTVSHGGTQHRLALLPDSLLSALQAELENLTSVPASLQKLIYKGKKAGYRDEELTLSEAGIKDGMKIQMIGTSTKDLEEMRGAENEQRKRERILKERAMKPQVKARSTGPGGSSIVTFSSLNSSPSTSQYKFQEIVPLTHLPHPETARTVLDKLASDPSIRHVMTKHKYTVGVLTELAPHEHPGLLGLNVNQGEAIKLRIRTDRYDGFRLYSEVRRVLCHELAHNVWKDHDNNFKELNSQLNREVYEYEQAVNGGAHTLSGAPLSQLSWSSSSEQEAEGQSYILGGSSGPSIPSDGDSPEQRRRRVLDATVNRLRNREEDLERSCGTGGSSS